MSAPDEPEPVKPDGALSVPEPPRVANSLTAAREPPPVVAPPTASARESEAPEARVAEATAEQTPGPSIERVAPDLGSTLGGTRVALEGHGFADGVEVKVDGVVVRALVESKERVVFTTMARNLPGRVDIDVVNPDGLRALAIQGFEYCLPPELVGVTPPRAPARGGVRITLNGRHLRQGSTVRIGASLPTVHYVGPDRIDLELVAHPAGTYDVELTGPAGQTARLPGGFVFCPPPRVDRIVPNHGPLSGGTRIVVQGEGFRNGCVLYLYTTSLAVDFVSEKELRAIVPPHAAPGPVTLRLEDPDGSQVELAGAFHYDRESPPRLDRVEPASGARGRENEVLLLGEGFVDGAAVYVMGAALAARFVSPECLVVALPPLDAVGFLDVEVENFDGQRCHLGRAFEIEGPPALARVTPTQGGTAGGAALKLDGGGFRAGCRVELGGAAAECEWISETVLRARAPSRSGSGRVDVTVTNPDGQSAILASAFEYVAPARAVIEKLEPRSGPTSRRTAVLLTGQGLGRVARVLVGGEPAPQFKAKGTMALAFFTPPRRSSGTCDVTLVLDDGTEVIRENAFRYEEAQAPVIRSIAPNRGSVAGRTEVVISGEHFAPGCRVLIGGEPVGSVTVKSATSLVVFTPPGNAGKMVDVCVESPSGKKAVASRAYLYDPRYR